MCGNVYMSVYKFRHPQNSSNDGESNEYTHVFQNHFEIEKHLERIADQSNTREYEDVPPQRGLNTELQRNGMRTTRSFPIENIDFNKHGGRLWT